MRLLPLWAAAGLLVVNLILFLSRGADAGGTAGVTGACCVPGAFACIEGTTEIECIVALGGIYQGNSTTCGGASCGACCRTATGSSTSRTF
ncbi:MAG: hypothetical protein ACYTES_19085 [Planctomycetota bacterium]